MRRTSLAAGAAAAAVAVLTAVPATAAVPARAASTPMCATSQLTAALGGGDAGAGNLYRYLVLTNHSAATCHLTGYPGVSLLDGGGNQIGPAATRAPGTYAPVVLRPGASASDTVHTANHMGTCLPTSAKVRVYPPGNTASLVIAGRIANCHDLLEITALAAGTGGNPAGSAPAPTAAPTAAPAPSDSGSQVTAVPSGAPDTGLAAGTAGGGDGPAIGAAAAGLLALGGAGVVAATRRRSRTRVQG